MGKITLITGGVRSGKSRFALELARSAPPLKKAFLATAQPFDEEMHDRILKHRKERENEFTTLEEPYDLACVLSSRSSEFDLIVIDCLTLWVNNLLYVFEQDEAAVEKRVEDFLVALDGAPS